MSSGSPRRTSLYRQTPNQSQSKIERTNHTTYDVAEDGRFLMLENVAGLNRIEAVANWFEEIIERVPVP